MGLAHEHMLKGLAHEHMLVGQAHEHVLSGLAHEHMLMGLAHEHLLLGQAHEHLLVDQAHEHVLRGRPVPGGRKTKLALACDQTKSCKVREHNFSAQPQIQAFGTRA